MKYCRYCGAENIDEALYCSKCGSRFDEIRVDNNNVRSSSHRFGLIASSMVLLLAVVTLALSALSYVGLIPSFHELFSKEQMQETVLVGEVYPSVPTCSIPEKLIADMDDVYYEYLPSITFHEDMTCDYSLNYYEEMVEGTGTYEVYSYINGAKTIACDLGVYAGFGRVSTIFYLTLEVDGTWRFLGEPLGMTEEEYGDTFTLEETATIEVECWEVDASMVPYDNRWDNGTETDAADSWLEIAPLNIGTFLYNAYGDEPFEYREEVAVLCPGGIALSIVSDYGESSLLEFRFCDDGTRFECVKSTGDKVPGYSIMYNTKQ